MQQTNMDLAHLKMKMTTREFPVLYDYLTPRESHLLDVTLSDYLPQYANSEPYSIPIMPMNENRRLLPPAHHLVYFPPTMPDSRLLPDGTDPEQSPGKPFVRRMWAGGEITFQTTPNQCLSVNGDRVACVEKIKDLSVKGHEGSEMIFVSVERRIGTGHEGEHEDMIREQLSNDSQASIIEIRNIVFMRESKGENKEPKALKPQYSADFSHVLTPNPKLLFRFSALTFNTHAIHRDLDYCHNVEHHPNLIVHGPLSLTLLLTLLRLHLAKSSPDEYIAIKQVKYRNTHPLYSGDPLKLCGHQTGEHEWQVWAETPQGNVAVKGTVYTEIVGKSAKPATLFHDVEELGAS